MGLAFGTAPGRVSICGRTKGRVWDASVCLRQHLLLGQELACDLGLDWGRVAARSSE